MGSVNLEGKWFFPIVVFSLICIFLLAMFLNAGHVSSIHKINAIFSSFPTHLSTNETSQVFSEPKVQKASSPPPPSRPALPCFAYLVSGSKGDLERLWRTLRALYHPWNQYIIHLDLESPAEERAELAFRVANDSIFARVGNVFMINNANMVTYRGPTMVANTLHACAILLKRNRDWDWFINLSASDYPLVTQDDLLYTFSTLSKRLNFIEHTNRLQWKFDKRAMPLMIDPALYSSNKSDIFWVNARRTLPTKFKLFTGSAWMVLSREFVEYMIWGWDNLPRTLLMYYTNFVSSPEGYFHTVICNVPEFSNTTVNHDLHYISWDHPPRQHPHALTLNDYDGMISSNAAFARKFNHNDPALDKIDNDLLHRDKHGFTPGRWCEDYPKCSKIGNPAKIKPGPGGQRLGRLIAKLVLAAQDGANQCK